MYIFGGGHRAKKAKPQFTGLAAQTSTTTVPVPIAFGLNRVAPNIIWQGDFASHKHKQQTGKGLGGSGSVTYTYSGSFDLALGWGPVSNIRRVWKDQSKPTFASLGLTLIAGSIPQAPWGFLTTNHASEALGYAGIAQVVIANYDLGAQNTLPQHSFEVEWPLLDTAPGGLGDADPAQCVDKLLHSTVFGALVGTPSITVELLLSTGAATTTGDQAFQTYCKALGLGFSPLLDSQEPCTTILDRWTMLMNTALCWTGYSLLFLPYGSETITGNGVTYLPDLAAKFAFGDDDFLANGTDDPIIVRRKAPSEGFNHVTLEIRNRSNEYNAQPVEWRDQGLIDAYGLNAQSSTKANDICEPTIGATLVALLGQRAAYVRNKFEFVVSYANMQLVCGLIGTITDPALGTKTVMITSIVDQGSSSKSGSAGLRIIAEEYAASLGASGTTPDQGVTNVPVNTAVAANSVNTPIIFEPPSTLGGLTPQVWFAVSAGPSGTFDPNWGGCNVWLSSDNVTFQQVGTINTPARMGVLGGALASYGGANPDITNSVSVNLSQSGGDLTSVTAADAAAFVTLCVIKDAGGTLEFLSFRDATLTSTYVYTIGGQLYRGLYGTAAASHLSGVSFARLDQNIFKFTLPSNYIGTTIYAKFQSFNVYGSGVQSLAACTAYSYATLGSGYGGGAGGVPTTPATPTLSAQTGFNLVTWTANPTTDNVTRYDVYRATGTSQPFGSSTLIGSSTGTSYTDSTAAAAQGYTYFIKAVNAVGASAASAGTNTTSAISASQPFGFAFGPKVPTINKPIGYFDSPIAWTIPASLTDSQGDIVDSDTAVAGAPTAQTDFDLQSPPGTSIGTMRFAASALTATFIKASPTSVPLGQSTILVAPANLNGITGAVAGTIKGTR